MTGPIRTNRNVRNLSDNGAKYSVLITGGAGFIGTNLADRLASSGRRVIIYDNLSRAGVDRNARWLRSRHGERIRIVVADVRDSARVKAAVQPVSHVFHLAAQVAVTSSLLDPRYDCEVNIGGTLNVLEALRCMDKPASLVFTSTNKVYGDLSDVNLQKSSTRYISGNSDHEFGVDEQAPLAFRSPYGCSKGAADQYVLDYARYFNLQAAVFRMSCIFGPHQMGTEDQGWIAHFLRRSIEGRPISICGDGLQVRDILFVDDLVDAFLLAQDNMPVISGHAFNIGGGCRNTISLVELLSLIESIHGGLPAIKTDDWRQGDQRFYVSDIRKFKDMTGWSPEVSAQDGVRKLYNWLVSEHSGSSGAEVGGEHAVLAG
ncbi:MAG TPA: SDR family NAD(P)-dependent oxidoreductase [Bryobacteraceae bacterium]|jgi:CDP-paratose 2-epimerase|nr:SDR family NAD(P)-dependent oxidoreductase [Bryobacteraceae bacterium]